MRQRDRFFNVWNGHDNRQLDRRDSKQLETFQAVNASSGFELSLPHAMSFAFEGPGAGTRGDEAVGSSSSCLQRDSRRTLRAPQLDEGHIRERGQCCRLSSTGRSERRMQVRLSPTKSLLISRPTSSPTMSAPPYRPASSSTAPTPGRCVSSASRPMSHRRRRGGPGGRPLALGRSGGSVISGAKSEIAFLAWALKAPHIAARAGAGGRTGHRRAETARPTWTRC
jgi:hypothetical protein